mgnify:CR=1 FL=1
MNGEIDKLITAALANLAPRQKEVVRMRFGLKSAPMTLAAIGDQYDITRERVRQIEAAALKTVANQTTAPVFNSLRQSIVNYLKKFNGVRRHDLLCRDLQVNGGKVNFLMNSAGLANYHPEDENFYEFWYLGEADLRRAQTFVNDTAAALKAGKKINHNDPATGNYVSFSKKFSVSPYGDFGLADWREINPKVSRDWAYLVLKKEAKPLHFTELTLAINKIRPNRRTNPQTIHNELIKDKRFVLVGRGTYGLTEFGIIPGTAKEVLAHFLKKNGAMKARELVKLVMDKRVFKEKTLLLNLQNKNYFKRLGDGRYHVV